jgi:hypothetical protein
MTVIRDVAGKWSCQVPTFDLPLQKGTRLIVEPKVLNRDRETSCELLEWQYRIANQEGKDASVVSDLELIVKEIRPGRFESWFQSLSPDTQFWAPTTTAILCLFIGAAVLYTLYVQPTHGLVFVGKHVRSAGCAIIILLFVFLLPIKFGLTRGPSNFRKPFFFALLVTSAWILCAFWLMFSNLPDRFDGSDAQYVTYAKSLGQSMSRSYWPILVAALPWLSVSFTIFGFDTAEKTSESLEKLTKEK